MQASTRHLRVPPLFFWCLAAACWWGAAKCYQFAHKASDPLASLSTIGCMLAGVVGGAMVLRALNDGDIRRDRRRFDRHRRQTAHAHGKSRFADARDAKKFDLTSGKGIFLGRIRGRFWRYRDLYYGGENHVLTIGPAGSGKGTCGVIPQLLTNPESMLVCDLKGELYLTTHRHRRDTLGHEIVVWCPYWESLSKELGRDIPDSGCDLASMLIRPGPSVKDDAELFASFMIPIPTGTDAKAEFFMDAGQTFATGGMLDLVRREIPPTPPELRRWLMASPQAMESQLLKMMACTAFGGVVAEIGGKLASTLANAPEEFQGGLSTAQKAVRIYDSFGPMGRHVCKHGFDPRRLKEKPTTVYLILPSDRGITHAHYMNLVLSATMELVGRDRTNKRVTFLIDELANLGYLPNLLRAMAQYRAQGVRVHGYIQQVSQVRRMYGMDGWRDMVGLCDVVQAFGVTEYETTKLLSDMAGQTTVDAVSQNIRPSVVDGMSHADASVGQSRVGTPLMRPEDIRTMDSNKQLIFFKNMQPLIADKVDYRNRRRWREWTDPNPYYDRPKS